jgi:hypothetical protein
MVDSASIGVAEMFSPFAKATIDAGSKSRRERRKDGGRQERERVLGEDWVKRRRG